MFWLSSLSHLCQLPVTRIKLPPNTNNRGLHLSTITSSEDMDSASNGRSSNICATLVCPDRHQKSGLEKRPALQRMNQSKKPTIGLVTFSFFWYETNDLINHKAFLQHLISLYQIPHFQGLCCHAIVNLETNHIHCSMNCKFQDCFVWSCKCSRELWIWPNLPI